MPVTTSSSVLSDVPSSMVIDPGVADLLHRFGDGAADLGVAVRRYGADLRDLGIRGDALGGLLQLTNEGFHRAIDAALQIHGVHAGGHRLGAAPGDRVREHDRGGGAVASPIGGPVGDLLNQLDAHILEFVVELDFLGDAHAVLGDLRAERPIDRDVPPSRSKRDAHGACENVDAVQQPVASLEREFEILGGHVLPPRTRNCSSAWHTRSLGCVGEIAPGQSKLVPHLDQRRGKLGDHMVLVARRGRDA